MGWRHLGGAAATVVALLACYGTTALLAIVSALGIHLAVNEGIWASVISIAALAAVVAVGANTRRHGRRWPLALASLGAAVIVYVMFIHYLPVAEALGFLVLVAAVAADFLLLARSRHDRQAAGRRAS